MEKKVPVKSIAQHQRETRAIILKLIEAAPHKHPGRIDETYVHKLDATISSLERWRDNLDSLSDRLGTAPPVLQLTCSVVAE